MAAPVGIKCAEQAVFGDRLGQPQEARHRPFLVHQDRRIDLPGGVVERHDEIQVAPERPDPTVGRAVLEQQHSRQRSPHPLLAMSAAPLGFRHQPSRLQ
jgi:hypothetical protein